MKSDKCFVIAGKLCCILLLSLLLKCSKSDSSTSDTQPPPPTPVAQDTSCVPCQLIYYGIGNQDAPTLNAGRYEAAARYTTEKIGNLVGKTIKEVRFYLTARPDSVRIKLYGPSNATTPGALLYSAEVTSATEPNKWNIHKLTQAITLKNEDIWLSIEFKISNSIRTIGCDPGPALKDGDWLLSSSDGLWTPFSKRSGGADINWNIRLNVGI